MGALISTTTAVEVDSSAQEATNEAALPFCNRRGRSKSQLEGVGARKAGRAVSRGMDVIVGRT